MDARRIMGFEAPLMAVLQQVLDVPVDEAAGKAGAYGRDARAMAATPADVKELPSAYEFVVDMPGLRPGDMKVQVEDGRVLAISGERRRVEETEGEAAKLKYLGMERRMGKLMRKFALPDDTDTEKVSAVYRDGVLTVTVEKLPPPEPQKARTIQVNIA